MENKISEMQIGKAGEYLTCVDLIMKGFIAFPSEQGLSYDVLLDTGSKLLRIQVKTCSSPRLVPQRKKTTEAYIFNIKRHGKNNKKKYTLESVDIFALVCLDTRKVGYIKNTDMPTTINLRVDRLRGTYYDEIGIQNYNKVVALSKIIKSQTEISKKLGLHVSEVNRMCKNGYVPYETNAKYFSDIERNIDWFLEI
ncbi:MAG: group I intron-associated PD-(D/E)XK endonuclease [Firmicutes bacterium]|nr:group I intron-associated PD-(D/E)XK endonuclease [Bacillota bacterium]